MGAKKPTENCLIASIFLTKGVYNSDTLQQMLIQHVRFLMCVVRCACEKLYTASVYKKVVNSTQKCLKNICIPQSSHRFHSGLTLLTNKQANNGICHDIKMPPPLPTPSLTCISLSKSCRFKILYLLLNPCQTKAYIYYSYSSRMPQTMRENCEKRYGTYTSY